MPFELPNLNYDYNALEPFIDAQTMEIHHSKHHQTYITNLNKALENYPDFQNKTVKELITHLNDLPTEIQTAVRNNGGGHYNHSLFWQLMTPDYHKPGETFLADLEQTFGTLEAFQEKFTAAGLGRFGSGWTWLIKREDKLEIISTPNQDNPLMDDANSVILLGLDVWEHAYYLKYQNKRADYIKEWWNVVNWVKVSELYQS